MAYLSNAAVNRLSIHTGLHMLAWNLSGNFFIAFFLSRGLSVIQVFLYIALILGLRFALRPIALFLAPRLGSRRMLYIGVGFFALEYVPLAFLKGTNAILLMYCVCCALSDIFYWLSYHAMYATAGDDPHRAKQVSVREALSTATAIVAPLAGGFAIDRFGALSVLALGAVIELLSIIPLLRVPNMPIAKKCPPGAFKGVMQGAAIFATDGWVATGLVFAWSVMLFNAADSSFTGFGVGIALAGFVSAVGGLVLGRLIDAGHAKRAVIFNGILLIAAILLKSSAGPQFGSVLGIAAISALLGASYMPVIMTALYSLAAKSPCPFRFIYVTECAWDIGCGACCLATAGLLFLGMPLNFAVAFAIPGAFLQTYLLHKYYARRR